MVKLSIYKVVGDSNQCTSGDHWETEFLRKPVMTLAYNNFGIYWSHFINFLPLQCNCLTICFSPSLMWSGAISILFTDTSASSFILRIPGCMSSLAGHCHITCILFALSLLSHKHRRQAIQADTPAPWYCHIHLLAITKYKKTCQISTKTYL